MEKDNKRKMLLVEHEAYEAFEEVKIALINQKKSSKVNTTDVLNELFKNREELKELKKRLENQ